MLARYRARDASGSARCGVHDVRLPRRERIRYIGAPMNPPTAPRSYLKSDGAVQEPDASGTTRFSGDDALVRRMAESDERALAELYDRWHPVVHGVVGRMLRQPDEVEEVVEEIFWQAWRQASRFDPARGAVQTWLLTIARSRALDRVRSLRRRREEPLEGDDGEAVTQVAASSDPGLDAEASERRLIVTAALSELPT